MSTCQCQKPLVNAHGCCGYCGKAASGQTAGGQAGTPRRVIDAVYLGGGKWREVYEGESAADAKREVLNQAAADINKVVDKIGTLPAGIRDKMIDAEIETIRFNDGGTLTTYADGVKELVEPINEVMLPPSGAMADGLMEFVEKGQREATSRKDDGSFPADMMRSAFCARCALPGIYFPLESADMEVMTYDMRTPTFLHQKCKAEYEQSQKEIREAFTDCRCGFFALGLPGNPCKKCGKNVPVFNTTTVHVTGEMVDSEKGVEIQVDGGGTVFYNTPKPSDLEHATARWRDCLEVIEQTYKRHPNGVGVPQESIRGNALYVLDWRPDEPKRMDAVKVEHVVSVDADGMVNMVGSVTDVETFASLVVGGPFPLEVESDGDE